MWANKKVTNDSARKTTIWKIKSFGFPKCEIKNIIGHNCERGIDACDSGNEDEMFGMSSAISKCTQQYLNYSTSTVTPKKKKKIKPSPSSEQSKLDFSWILYLTPVDNNNFSFGINWNNFSQPQLSKPLDNCSADIFSFQWMPGKHKY